MPYPIYPSVLLRARILRVLDLSILLHSGGPYGQDGRTRPDRTNPDGLTAESDRPGADGMSCIEQIIRYLVVPIHGSKRFPDFPIRLVET